MSKLIITIKFPVGFYTISIDGKFVVVTYYPEKLTNKPEIMSIIDMDEELFVKFEDNKVDRISNIKDRKHRFPYNPVSPPTIIGNADILGYNCTIYDTQYEYKEKGHSKKGQPVIRVISYFSHVPLLKKYLYNDNVIGLIPWIGTNGFKHFGKFKLKSEEITNSVPLLIFEVIGIETKDELPTEVNIAITKMKDALRKNEEWRMNGE